MTEKRFIPIFDGTDKRVVGAKDNGKIISFMDMFDLLNDLSEENEKLHHAIVETEKMVQSTYDELTKLRCIKKNLGRIKVQWDWIMEAIQYD